MKAIFKIYVESEDELYRLIERMQGIGIPIRVAGHIAHPDPQDAQASPQASDHQDTGIEYHPDIVPSAEFTTRKRRVIEHITCEYKHCHKAFFTKTDQRFCSRECAGKDRRDRNQDAKLARIKSEIKVKRGRPRITRQTEHV